MNYKLNSIRVDFKPDVRVSDLDLAHARRLFHVHNSVIKRQYFTVKFTSTLHLQVWFKSDITSLSVRSHLKDVYKIYERLNNIKPTKVCVRTAKGIINLQASGRFDKKVELFSIAKQKLPEHYKLLATSGLAEPFMQVQSILKGDSVRFLQITRNYSSHLRICYSGNFTIIARNVVEYKELIRIAQTLSNHP